MAVEPCKQTILGRLYISNLDQVRLLRFKANRIRKTLNLEIPKKDAELQHNRQNGGRGQNDARTSQRTHIDLVIQIGLHASGRQDQLHLLHKIQTLLGRDPDALRRSRCPTGPRRHTPRYRARPGTQMEATSPQGGWKRYEKSNSAGKLGQDNLGPLPARVPAPIPDHFSPPDGLRRNPLARLRLDQLFRHQTAHQGPAPHATDHARRLPHITDCGP